MAFVRVLLLLLAISAVLSAPNPLNRVKRDDTQGAAEQKNDEEQPGYTGFDNRNNQPETRAESESRFSSNTRQDVEIRPVGSYPTNTAGKRYPDSVQAKPGYTGLTNQIYQQSTGAENGAQPVDSRQAALSPSNFVVGSRQAAPSPSKFGVGNRLPAPSPSNFGVGSRQAAPLPSNFGVGSRIPAPSPTSVAEGSRLPAPLPSNVAGYSGPKSSGEPAGQNGQDTLQPKQGYTGLQSVQGTRTEYGAQPSNVRGQNTGSEQPVALPSNTAGYQVPRTTGNLGTTYTGYERESGTSNKSRVPAPSGVSTNMVGYTGPSNSLSAAYESNQPMDRPKEGLTGSISPSIQPSQKAESGTPGQNTWNSEPRLSGSPNPGAPQNAVNSGIRTFGTQSSGVAEIAKSPSPTPSPAQPVDNQITQVSSSTVSSSAKTTTVQAENPAPAGSTNQTAQVVTPTVRLDGVASGTNKSTPAPALKSTSTLAPPKEEPNKASSVPSTVKSTLSTSTSNQPSTLSQAIASSTVNLAPPPHEKEKQPTPGAPSPSSTKSTTIPVQPVATQAKTEDKDSTGEGNGNPPLTGDEEDKKKDAERKTGDDVEEEESTSSHFMAYFITACVLCVIGYLGFHNKQKILAYIIEGRKNQRRRAKNGGASYKRLDNTVEESMDINNRTKDYIY